MTLSVNACGIASSPERGSFIVPVLQKQKKLSLRESWRFSA